MPLNQRWTVRLFECPEGGYRARLTHFDATTRTGGGSYEFSGSSSVIFQELLTVLDASIFTSLAIAENVLPEGQLPLV
jgi:hypothetical protein